MREFKEEEEMKDLEVEYQETKNQSAFSEITPEMSTDTEVRLEWAILYSALSSMARHVFLTAKLPTCKRRQALLKLLHGGCSCAKSNALALLL